MKRENMKRFTLDQIMLWKPCEPEYSRENIQKLMDCKKTMTVKDVMALPIPDADKLWCLLRPEVIAEKDLHELACKFAERALKRERKAGREPHKDSWNAIKVKRLWIKDKATNQELIAAMSAAMSAATSAAMSAAMSAATSAAIYAARYAAMSAATSAAMSAARDEATSAARYAEIKRQLKQAYKMALQSLTKRKTRSGNEGK